MRIRYLFWILLLSLAGAAGFAIGRFQTDRTSGTTSDAKTSSPSFGQSMVGKRQSSRSFGQGDSLPPLDENLGGREIMERLLAAQAAVSPENMELAIQKAAEESDPIQSNLLFAQLLQMLTPENAKAALESLTEVPRNSLTDTQLRLFRFAWGQVDGPAAADHVIETLDGRSRGWAAYSVMAGWASNEPEAAIAWTGKIEEERQRDSFYRGIVGGLAKTDPDFATRLAMERHAAGDRDADDYISTIAREQLRLGLDTVTPWIDSITEPELKQGAVYQVARTHVHRDPEEAAQWVEAYVGNDFATAAIGEVADEWAEDDGAAAVAWVAQLPLGDAKTKAFGQVFNEWTEDDPLSASQYLVAMPDGPDRDAGAQALSRRHAREDPEAAVTWAASIGDEAIRTSSLVYTGQQWMRREPEKAGAWLAVSGLPEDVQEKIRTPGQNRSNWRSRFVAPGSRNGTQ